MIDKINIALISATAGGLIWIFTNFASAEDVKQMQQQFEGQLNGLTVSIKMGQYYDRLDDMLDAEDAGNDELADEYERQLEQLRADICLHRPDWERCEVTDT